LRCFESFSNDAKVFAGFLSAEEILQKVQIFATKRWYPISWEKYLFVKNFTEFVTFCKKIKIFVISNFFTKRRSFQDCAL